MNKIQKAKKLEENKDDIINQFSKYLCDSCKPRLEKVGTPIKERLDAGKKLRLKDTIKITKCLCGDCIKQIKDNLGDALK